MKMGVINNIHTLKVNWTDTSRDVVMAVALVETTDLLATRDLKEQRRKHTGTCERVEARVRNRGK